MSRITFRVSHSQITLWQCRHSWLFVCFCFCVGSPTGCAAAVRDRFELEFQRGRISFHKVKTVNLYHVATTGLTDFAFCRTVLVVRLAAVFRNWNMKMKSIWPKKTWLAAITQCMQADLVQFSSVQFSFCFFHLVDLIFSCILKSPSPHTN